MECDTKVYTLFSELHSLTMNETKFIIYGHDESKQMNECLSYIAETAEDAVARCIEFHPNFNIHYVSIDDSEVDVIKVQSLR